MAAVAMETVHGYAIRPNVGLERGRAQARIATPNSRDASPMPRNADFPRSASYTYLPEAKEPGYANPSIVTIKGSFSEADLIASADDLADISPPDSSGWTTPDENLAIEPKVPVDQARELIAQLQRSPKITVQRFTKPAEDEKSSDHSSERRPSAASSSIESSRTASTAATTPLTQTPRSRPASQSFSRRFNNRKSWYGSASSTPPSRSPSPPKQEKTIRPHEVGPEGAPAPPSAGTLSRKRSLIRRKGSRKSVKEKKTEQKFEQKADKDAAQSSDEPERPVTRRSTIVRRKTRPISGIFTKAQFEESVTSIPPIPRIPSLPKSFSTDKLPTYRTGTPVNGRAAPMPRLVSNERSMNGNLSIPIRKKDELWGVFRTLDGDYTKFASKSTAFKANVVRASLLPFLRTYAVHPSNRSLRLEDLDRRANILNKWWTGLIEMLHGRNNQSISGTDRPAILDGISGIMERSEWRLHPSPFCPLNQRMKGTSTPRNRSTTSLSSSTSDFLADSVFHNVRNIFIQNLSAQMAFVVDKMSLRNASASLVTFCGKACAYAFMFVPGMADVLVRLWDLQLDVLRRVLDENGIGKFDNSGYKGSSIVSSFPPCLHQLGFSSLMKYMRKLRTPPPLPLGTANIQWWGHWLERWTGRESDLFYVFVKYYHILATDFLPADVTKKDKMCAPGMLLVHAQIVTNLDATIHRSTIQAPQDPAMGGPSPTFDDVLSDPDAVASALPLPPTTNAVRVMAENRLIMLIRDFLSERTADHPVARELFAESFNDILQTAARGISVFDHAACYTLLDFLEEALVILVRYEHLKQSEGTLINSDFWQEVCKKMIGSHNTMTEVRLYAFLYTIWHTVIADLGRKADLCLGLLLEPEIFESRFNHWCPMVRAYYMRLICWRVGRYDGELARGDVLIYETLLERLQSTWSHYLFLRSKAEREHALLPPTNPCNPAPSRRLLIIRTDTQIAPGGSFLSFDGFGVNPTPTAPQLASKRHSTLSPMVELDTRANMLRSSSETELVESRDRSLGGFFRKMMGSKSRSSSKSRSRSRGPPTERPRTQSSASDMPMPTPKLNGGLIRSATDDLQAPRQRGSSLIDLGLRPPGTAGGAQQHRNYSFKFSLEYQPNKPAPGPLRLQPPRLPLPAQQFLQSHSQRAQPSSHIRPTEPQGASIASSRYCGRALAEWMVVVGEGQSFFERRLKEGVPGNKSVETPTLGVEVFKRPS